MTQVWRVTNHTFSSNTYLCETPVSGECLIIDPGLDAGPIDDHLSKLKLKPVGVFCTHGHFDHVGTADFFKKKYGIPLFLHRDDLKLANSSNFLLMACKINARISVPSVDFLTEDGFEMIISGVTLSYTHVPGHTPGSCFIEYNGAIFTGDSMYKNGVGLVDFPGEKPEILKQSLLKVWDHFPESHHVYPGHGGSGRLGEIKSGNQKLRLFLGLDQGAGDPGKLGVKRIRTGSEARLAFEEELE